MSVHVVRLPDVGEGVAEAELVSWFVAVGDTVTPDTVVAEVLTDKATVEIYAPVAGTVADLHGAAGDVLAVGSDLIAIETGDAPTPPAAETTPIEPRATAEITSPEEPAPEPTIRRADTGADGARRRAIAAPAVRQRARRLGLDLDEITGSGPDGRITHDDLDRRLARTTPDTEVPAEVNTPLIGLRRRIADHVTTASSRIPHITYVDEVDMTRIERMRHTLAAAYPNQPRLTVLPFVMRAIVLAVIDQPHLNSTFDDDAEVLTTFGAIHVGIATQTANGLIVPVVRDVQAMDLWQSAAELARVTVAARDGTAPRAELSGSTITITSLGALGGLMTTPIINRPEVAIVGTNKMQTRPMWNGTSFVPRTMMNLSSSFDHRIVDGWDAATFIQRIKTLLEEPTLLVLPSP